MADFEFNIDADFLKELDVFSDSETAMEMVNESLPILENSIKNALEPHRQTGGLIKSVKSGKAKIASNGAIIGNVTFSGNDKKGNPNVVKATGLEYGNSHQAAKPFMSKAVRACEDEVLDKMQEIYNRKVGAD